MSALEKWEACGHQQERKLPIDGGTRTLKNRSGIHLFCQKENSPAGVAYKAYKNLAILSCAAVLPEQLTRLKANLQKLRSRPGIAKLLPWSSGKHPNNVVYTKISLVPRESCSFIYAKKMKRNVCYQVLLCNEIVMLATSRCFYILSCECKDRYCSLFKVCSGWKSRICCWVFEWANSYEQRFPRAGLRQQQTTSLQSATMTAFMIVLVLYN